MDKSNALKEIASETEHKQWAGELVLPCCLSSPVSTDCLIRKIINFPSINVPLLLGWTTYGPHSCLQQHWRMVLVQNVRSIHSAQIATTLHWLGLKHTWCVKNATGSVLTTNSTLSLTERKVQGVLWEGKLKEMGFLHGRKLCPALLRYLPLHNSASTPNNLCSCTAAPSFTLLPHLPQIPHTRDPLSNSLR